MSYKQLFENDIRYQRFINEFKEGKQTILKATKSNVMQGTAIVGAINKVVGDLQQNVRGFNKTKREELEQEQQKIIDSYQQNIDYTTNQAKQLEVKFKLAEDRELKAFVNELDTDDMLYINLLRLELKKRDMQDQDRIVKNHVINLEGEYRNNERFNELQKGIATLNTITNNAVILDGEHKLIDNIRDQLTKEVHDITMSNANKKRSDSQAFADMQKYTQALNEL